MRKRAIVHGPGVSDATTSTTPAKGSPLAVPLRSPAFTNKPRLVTELTESAPSLERQSAESTPETQSSSPEVVQAPSFGESVEKHSPTFHPIDGDSYYEIINARLIDQNSHPPRQLYTDDDIRVIAESIQENSQRDAIHVIPHPSMPGRFVIGDGWTRVQAIRAYDLNGGMVRAIVHTNLSEEEASWLGYNQNEQRKAAHDYDRAVFYQSWHNSGMTWAEIGKKIGASEAHMQNFAAFGKLSPELLLLVKLHPKRFTISNISQFQKLESRTNSSTALNFAHRFLAGEYPVKWVTEQVNELVEKFGGNPKKRSNSNTVMFQRRFPDGYYRQRRSGKVELNITIPEERIEEFNLAVESLLKQYVDEQDAESAPPDSIRQESGNSSLQPD